MYKCISEAADSFLKYVKSGKPKNWAYTECSEEPEQVIIISTPDSFIREGRRLMKEMTKKR